MLEEAAPLTEPPQGGWLGEWLLSVLGCSRVVTVLAVRTVIVLVVTVLATTNLVACPGAGC